MDRKAFLLGAMTRAMQHEGIPPGEIQAFLDMESVLELTSGYEQ